MVDHLEGPITIYFFIEKGLGRFKKVVDLPCRHGFGWAIRGRMLL